MRRTSIIILFLLTVTLAHASTIKVPTDQPTIQDGINAASDFDTVLVAPGVYLASLNLTTKTITLLSEAGAAGTTLHQPSVGQTIISIPDESNNQSSIIGFTFSDANAQQLIYVGTSNRPFIKECIFENNSLIGNLGVIKIFGRKTTVVSCIFRNNNVVGKGGCIFLSADSCTISESIFHDNASWDGAAIVVNYSSDALISRCLIYHNVLNPPYYGGAVYIEYSHRTIVNNCTFVSNVTDTITAGTAISSVYSDHLVLENTIVAFNSGGSAAVKAFSHDFSTHEYMSYYGNVPLNFLDLTVPPGLVSSDPLFIDTTVFDFHLQVTSPCVDAGNPDPAFNDPDGTRNDMGALLLLSALNPVISFCKVDNQSNNTHIISNNPIITWNKQDASISQTSFEIAVGTDANWNFAEMWNPASFNSADTFITYNGAPLLDGHTYYFRLRVSDSSQWSSWFNSSFRMNTAPTSPNASTTPKLYSIVNPTLYVHNASDVENDALTYYYQVYSDSLLATLVAQGNSTQTLDSTGWTVALSLNENSHYWWRARTYDGFEYSNYSQTGSFYTNFTPEPPSFPYLIQPPDSTGKPTFNMLPTFQWHVSTDPDPLDTVHYKLQISINSSFTFLTTIDSLTTIQYTLTDSLEFGKHYYWRVTAFDTEGQTAQTDASNFWTWMLGDVNHSHTLNVLDLNYMVSYFFSGGPAISPHFVGDMNGSCSVNVLDLNYLVAYFFSGGPAPKIGCGPATIP